MGIPTEAEVFTQIIEHLRKAQEGYAMLAHLRRDADRANALGFLKLSEMMKYIVKGTTDLATGKITGIDWSKLN